MMILQFLCEHFMRHGDGYGHGHGLTTFEVNSLLASVGVPALLLLHLSACHNQWGRLVRGGTGRLEVVCLQICGRTKNDWQAANTLSGSS